MWRLLEVMKRKKIILKADAIWIYFSDVHSSLKYPQVLKALSWLLRKLKLNLAFPLLKNYNHGFHLTIYLII